MTLIDVVRILNSFDAEGTIYAELPWSTASRAVVENEPELGGIPPGAAELNASYFLEVFVAREVLNGWRANLEHSPGTTEQCDRLIEYASKDA